MEINYSSDDSYIPEYEIYFGEAYDGQKGEDVNAFIYNDGYKKKSYWFATAQECLDFVGVNAPAKISKYFHDHSDLIEAGEDISVTKEQIKAYQMMEKYISEAPEVIRKLFFTYRNFYDFEYLFENKDNIEKTERTFFVYNWHTVPDHKVFYVNSGSEETPLKPAHCERKSLIDLIQIHFDVEPEIVIPNLTYIESQIGMRGLMCQYTDEGDYVLGDTVQHYRNYKSNPDKSIFRPREIVKEYYKPGFVKDELYKRYFSDIELLMDYDDVDDAYLTNVFLWNVKSEDLRDLKILLKNDLCSVDDNILKRTKSVIVDGDIDITDYIIFRDKNLKIFRKSDVEEYILAKLGDKAYEKPSIPEHEIEIHPVHNRCPLSEIKNLGDFKSSFDIGFPLYEQGEKLRKNGEIEEAIKLYDQARENGYDAPALYEAYVKAYRKLKDYDNVVAILQEQYERMFNSSKQHKTIDEENDPFWIAFKEKIDKEKVKLLKQRNK